jgi:enamine deaminase RidA (YjgF/YER057c/UK114 family)
MSNKKQIVIDNQPTVFPSFPHAVKAGGLVFLSGMRSSQNPTSYRRFSDIPKQGHDKKQDFLMADHLESQVAHDSWYTHQNMDAALEAAGSGPDQVLRQHIWQGDKRFFPVYQNIRQVLQKVPAPSSGLGVTEVFGDTNGTIGIDAIGVCPGDNPDLPAREVVASMDDKELPAASFYSQAVRTGPLVFTAGHIPIKTSTEGKPVVKSFDDIPPEGRFLETGQSHPDSRDGPIASQTWFIYNELKRTLKNQGLKLSDTLNSTVYLADIRDFPTFHRVHRHFFPDANTALTVSGFAEVGHRGCLIEIELTASTAHKNFSKTIADWPMSSPFAAPAAVRAGDFIFYSGVLGINKDCRVVTEPEDFGALAPEIPEGLLSKIGEYAEVSHESWAALHLLSKISQGVGSSMNDLLKITVYLENPASFTIFERMLLRLVSKENLPAVECVIIPNPGPIPEAQIQLEAIGWSGE